MKGAVGIHPFSWLVDWLLFVGRISDTEYHRIAGYLQKQREHQNEDLVPNDLNPKEMEIVRTINLLDKGYRSREDTAAEDQLLLQPVYGKSDQKFSGRDTIISGSVASTRSGNERGVNVGKRPGWMKEGFKVNTDPKMFDDIWLCWTFQANFMYDPVL